MGIRTFARVGIAILLPMVVTASPVAAVGQAAKTTDVSRFLGSWTGDQKANDKTFQSGLIPRDHGLRISATSDALVVTTTFRRPAADSWTGSDTLSYKLDGSTSPNSLNGWSATTRLAKDGDALVLTVLQGSGAQAGGTGAGPATPPPLGNVLQTMTMSVEGDRLKLEWSRGQFTATLSYDRQK